MNAEVRATNARLSHWILMGATGIAMLAAVMGCLKLLENPSPVRPVSVKAEHAAAESLLGEKLSGPGYFSAAAGTRPEGGILWIDVNDAFHQIERVVAERKLTAEGAESLRQLIDQLAESHPYRMMGGKRINLSRLNLSLETIK